MIRLLCYSQNLCAFPLQKVSTDEQSALEVVSYVGCAVSIVCLIITVTFFLLQRYATNYYWVNVAIQVITVIFVCQKEVICQSPLFRPSQSCLHSFAGKPCIRFQCSTSNSK